LIPIRDCASVVLAAGASTRLGRPKQLLSIHGESLLRRAARLAMEAGCSPNLILLGAHAEILKPEVDGSKYEVVENPGWQEGMGSSIRVAMKSLLARPKVPNAVLLLVCDQPELSAELLVTLLNIHNGRGDAIVASHYSGVLGVPAVFGSDYFAELAMLSGENGARRVIARHVEHAFGVAFEGGNFDIDLPEDVVKLRHTNEE
jgi:molybdenum cofactor cytidylyltransferase